jgi:hypothetical protein
MCASVEFPFSIFRKTQLLVLICIIFAADTTDAAAVNSINNLTVDYFAAHHDSLEPPTHYHTNGYDADSFGGGGGAAASMYSEQANMIIGYNERIAGLCRSYLAADQLERRQGGGHNSQSNSVIGLAVGLLKASVSC